MRAVRFASQLEFALDPATEAAIAPALPSLRKVSRERVSDELRKLLGAARPSRGIEIAARTGILDDDLAGRRSSSCGVPIASHRISGSPCLFEKVRRSQADERPVEGVEVLERRGRSGRGAWPGARAGSFARPRTSVGARRVMASIGRDRSLELARSSTASSERACSPASSRRIRSCRRISRSPATTSCRPGSRPGASSASCSASCSRRVLDDPALNTRDQLLALAKELA